MRFFLSGVEPEDGIDIKMHQPGGGFPLLTDFFLISVFYDWQLIAGGGGPVVMAEAIIKDRVDPCLFSAGVNDALGINKSF